MHKKWDDGGKETHACSQLLHEQIEEHTKTIITAIMELSFCLINQVFKLGNVLYMGP